LILGIILTVTDPTKILKVLKQIGSSKRMNTLIEGEGLFNSAVGVTLFMLVREVMLEEITETEEIA
jgi:NhaP-type Na+/H+ or K+/H+ antiporter